MNRSGVLLQGLVRLGLAVLVLTPFLCSEVPLLAWGAEGWWTPVLAASTPVDRVWWAVGCALLALALHGKRKWLWATVFLIFCVVGLVVWAIWGAAPVRETAGFWDAMRSDDASLQTIDAPHAVSWRARAGADVPAFQSAFVDASHPLGTDGAARDVLARLLEATRISLLVGLVATALAALVGIGLGALGGWSERGDRLVRPLMQLVATFPLLLFLMVFAASRAASTSSRETPHVLGELFALIVLVGLTRWTGFARLTRHRVRTTRARDWVLAARAQGWPSRFIVWRHVLPHAWPSLKVALPYAVIQTILLESALSFLGLGLAEPTVSLGTLLSVARDDLRAGAHVMVAGGVVLFMALVAIRATVERRRPAEAADV